MIVRKAFGLLLLVASGLLLFGCSPKAADYVPVPKAGQSGPNAFCNIAGGKLVVTIKNQGSLDATKKSTTYVEFSPGGSSPSITTPAIPKGGTVTLPGVDIPGACFNPDCNFTIHVNENGAVQGENKANNAAAGVCIG